ncbi:MAG: signal peptidase I [Candidatus Syntropharchaeales archaeon]
MNAYITALLTTAITGVLFYLLYKVKKGEGQLLMAFLGRIYEIKRSRDRKERLNMKMAEYRDLLHLDAPTILGFVLTLTVFTLIVFALLFNLVFFTVVVSGSMSPTFDRGDLVLMQSIDKDKIEVGDIILFDPPESLTPYTHRVVSVKGGRIRTQGDAVGVADPWTLSTDEVIAKAVIFNGKPIVVKDVGSYFILDYTKQEQKVGGRYGGEYTFIKNLLNAVKAWGYALCIIAVMGYILLSAKEMGGKLS